MQMHGLHGGDSGDLVTNAYLWGIPHPPGYPLYTFLSGFFIRLIQIDTVAWRVSFMSSLPMAISLYFLWRLSYRLTQSIVGSTIAVIVYGLTGVVWLNAITQEVFALFSLFSAVFMERFVAWWQEKKQHQLLFLAFWSGLALSHHPLIILCIIPACISVLTASSECKKQVFRQWWKLVLFGSVGLIPYVYLPIVSALGTPLDLENASTFQGFIRLVTRASYGSFRASSGAAPSMLDRLMNVYTFFQFSLHDFGWISLPFIGIGLVYLRKTVRGVYDYVTLCLFLWIFYYFYAGFPLLLNYHIGTIERFFIVPYQLLVCFIAAGVGFFVQHTYHVIRRIPYVVIIGLTVVGICSAQIRLWSTLYEAYTYLHTDQSMEQLGDDLLQSIPPNSIVLLNQDTTIYSMYYVYYVLHKRPDIKLIKLMWFGQSHYLRYLERAYPDLYIPQKSETGSGSLMSEFLSKNGSKFPIVSDEETSWIDGGIWSPNGLMFVFFPAKDVVIDHELSARLNVALWERLHPPVQLHTYQQQLIMLSDVLRVYAQHKNSIVKELVMAKAPIESILEVLQTSLNMEINVVPEVYIYSVVMLYEDGRCDDAKKMLAFFTKKWGQDRTVLEYYYKWSLACGADPEVDTQSQLFKMRFPKDIDALAK